MDDALLDSARVFNCSWDALHQWIELLSPIIIDNYDGFKVKSIELEP